MTLEGRIIGFDEFMNIVLDEAKESYIYYIFLFLLKIRIYIYSIYSTIFSHIYNL